MVEAHEALAGAERDRFRRQRRGRASCSTPTVEVLVTDGFTGNVVLKTIEGTARRSPTRSERAARSGPRAAAGGLLLRPALGGLREDMDPDGTGGAILLGLRGVAVVGHGSSGDARGRQPDPARGPRGQRARRRADRGADRALRRRAAPPIREAASRDTQSAMTATEEQSQADRGSIFSDGQGPPGRRARGGARPRSPTQTRFRDDLDADSLDLYELVMELEDTYGVAMSEDEAAKIETVGAAVDFVFERLPGA